MDRDLRRAHRVVLAFVRAVFLATVFLATVFLATAFFTAVFLTAVRLLLRPCVVGCAARFAAGESAPSARFVATDLRADEGRLVSGVAAASASVFRSACARRPAVGWLPKTRLMVSL